MAKLSISPLSGSQSHAWPLSLTSSRSTSEGGPGWLSRAKFGQRDPGPWQTLQSLGWQVPLTRAAAQGWGFGAAPDNVGWSNGPTQAPAHVDFWTWPALEQRSSLESPVQSSSSIQALALHPLHIDNNWLLGTFQQGWRLGRSKVYIPCIGSLWCGKALRKGVWVQTRIRPHLLYLLRRQNVLAERAYVLA